MLVIAYQSEIDALAIFASVLVLTGIDFFLMRHRVVAHGGYFIALISTVIGVVAQPFSWYAHLVLTFELVYLAVVGAVVLVFAAWALDGTIA